MVVRRCCTPQLRGADIPEVVIGKARLALATKRTVGDEDEMRILWQTFKKVRLGALLWVRVGVRF